MTSPIQCESSDTDGRHTITATSALSGTPPCLHCYAEGPVGWLVVDNAPRLNAMTLAMWHQLDEGAAKLGADPAVRVVILAGKGGKAFCSGGDISEFSELRFGAKAIETYDSVGKVALNRLAALPKPTIALIEGYCLGGGVAMAVRCDLRIAADTAQLAIPAARLGLSYDFPSVQKLVGLVGPSSAKLILYSGRRFGAEESLRMGLVNEVVAAARVVDHVRALAESLAANSPLSQTASKLIVDMVMRDESQRDLAACVAAENACLSSEDYAEATRAFAEKRPPVFKGR